MALPAWHLVHGGVGIGFQVPQQLDDVLLHSQVLGGRQDVKQDLLALQQAGKQAVQEGMGVVGC